MRHFAAALSAVALAITPQRIAAQTDPAVRMRRVDSLFAPWARQDSPGAVVVVLRNGQVVLRRGYGLASLEHPAPITPATVFDVASVSKQFTGLAIAMLVEQGKIHLTDDIRRYIPEMRIPGPLTIDQLVHHTSGLRDWPQTLHIAGWSYDDVMSFDQILWFAEHQTTLNFPAGTQYSYSNTEYNLLAELVARVTGQSFRAWTDEHLFAPLGMTHTHFRDDRTEMIPDRAFSYARNQGAWHLTTDNLVALGSSSLFTTADDLAKWLLNFETRTVGGAALDRVVTRGVLADGSTIPYAFGLVVGTYRGVPTVDHDGAWAQFSTYVGRFPAQRFGVIVLANTATINATQMAHRVADIFLTQDLAPRPPVADTANAPAVTLARAVLDRYAGYYRLGPGWVLSIRRNGDTLTTEATREPAFTMSARSDSVFWVPGYGSTMIFSRTRGDSIVLTYHGERHARLDAPPRLSAAQLNAFAGEYYSSELETSYVVQVRDTVLVLIHPRYGANALIPLWHDEFASPLWFGNVQFERDAAGKVTAFLATAIDRSRNTRFERRPAPPIKSAP